MANIGKPVIKCPHCDVTYDSKSGEIGRPAQIEDTRGRWFVQTTKCPSCDNFRIQIVCVDREPSQAPVISNNTVNLNKHIVEGKPNYQRVVYPFPATKRLPDSVTEDIRKDYNDAFAILEIAPRASAAASRRCMQTIIRQHFKITERNLYEEIEEIKKTALLPTAVVDMLHMLREFGNFGAHPIAGAAGEIIDVEPNEAEMMITILETLIDEAYERPALLQKTHDSLKSKKPTPT